MKTTTLPPLRVTPELRRDAESVLADGETLSSFVLASVERHVESRRAAQLFLERGIASGERARADAVMKDLRRRLKDAEVRAERRRAIRRCAGN